MISHADRDKLDSLIERIDIARKAADPSANLTARCAKNAGQRQTLAVVRIGSDFVALVVLSGALGWFLDRLWDTSPWALLGFVVLGFVAGMGLVFRFLSSQASRPEDPEKQD